MIVLSGFLGYSRIRSVRQNSAERTLRKILWQKQSFFKRCTMRGDPKPTQDLYVPPLVKLIEQWSVERLIPYARNARTHSDAQVAQIAASIYLQ